MPNSLLFSFILILLLGFIGGQLARKIGAPPLLGMILVGIFLGTDASNLIADRVINIADDLRTFAVMVILMRAGLGLDRDKLAKQGSVALRLGFLPALTEAIAISFLAIWLFQFNWLTGLLLGCVVSAESPAVIVPGMLRLKNLGWGVSKGIADAILMGSALSNVLMLLIFSLLLNFLTQLGLNTGINSSEIWLLPIRVVVQIIFGVMIGYLTAKLIVFCAAKQKWSQNKVQNTLVTASLAMLAIVVATQLPYFSGYLVVMAMGFFLIEFSPPLARQLRQEFNHLWIVAEILLFVLMGATIQLKILENILIPGILLLLLSLLFGRSIGWYLATLRSNWTWREKLFLLPGNSAKATVQAAIGAVPLSLGIPGGDIILAIAALSILITAPLGAWAIPTFAPKLLTRDRVDPSKTSLLTPTVIVGAVCSISSAVAVFTKVADLARRTDGEAVLVLAIHNSGESDSRELELLAAKLMLDIPYKLVTSPLTASRENVAAEILALAQKHNAIAIVLAQEQYVESNSINSLVQSILEYNTFGIPVMLVNDLSTRKV